VKVDHIAFNNNHIDLSAGFGSTVNIANSRFFGTSASGVLLFGGTSGTTNIAITDSQFTGTYTTFCIANQASPGTTGNITAARVTMSTCYSAFVPDDLR